MILGQEQINRYLRHIIMPEISGPGQRQLLNSSVLVKAESPAVCAPLLYYLAAAGIGNITCDFATDHDYEILFSNINDLNNDIVITLNNNRPVTIRPAIKIVFGSTEYLAHNLDDASDCLAVIVAANQGWKGCIQSWKLPTDRCKEATRLPREMISTDTDLVKDDDYKIGSVFSSCLLGALAAIESVKFILNIGTAVNKPLEFDLLTMRFNNQNDPDEDAASKAGEWPRPVKGRRLGECKALVVGTGGLGSPAAYALVRAGIGTIGLVDYDKVDISNLNRQILHSSSRLGWAKVDSAEVFLRQLNPDINLVKHNIAFNKDNAMEIINGYDVVIDGVDNFPTRYLINDACFLAQKPMIEAGVIRFDGIGLTIIPGVSACYRCFFPNIPAPGSVPSCSETGILGPVPGVMGFIEACEASKLLMGKGNILNDSIMSFDALDLSFNILNARKNPQCPLCGLHPTMRELQDYEFVCADES